MKTPRYRAVLAILSLIAVCSCATAVNNDEESARETEAMLEDAGFTKVPVDVPSEDLEHLPTFTLNDYQSISGHVFWYYDPEYCQCLYEGTDAENERYEIALQHENDLAEYEESENEESAMQQALMASAFNGAVPTPFFWGGWGAWYGAGMGYYGGGGHHGGGGGSGGGGHNPKPVGGGHHHGGGGSGGGIPGGGGHSHGGGGGGGGSGSHFGGGGGGSHFGGGGGGGHH